MQATVDHIMEEETNVGFRELWEAKWNTEENL